MCLLDRWQNAAQIEIDSPDEFLIGAQVRWSQVQHSEFREDMRVDVIVLWRIGPLIAGGRGCDVHESDRFHAATEAAQNRHFTLPFKRHKALAIDVGHRNIGAAECYESSDVSGGTVTECRTHGQLLLQDRRLQNLLFRCDDKRRDFDGLDIIVNSLSLPVAENLCELTIWLEPLTTDMRHNGQRLLQDETVARFDSICATSIHAACQLSKIESRIMPPETQPKSALSTGGTMTPNVGAACCAKNRHHLAAEADWFRLRAHGVREKQADRYTSKEAAIPK